MALKKTNYYGRLKKIITITKKDRSRAASHFNISLENTVFSNIKIDKRRSYRGEAELRLGWCFRRRREKVYFFRG